jgi:hypothetical protein
MKHLLTTALIATTLASPVMGEIAVPKSVHDFYGVCEPSKSNSKAYNEQS